MNNLVKKLQMLVCLAAVICLTAAAGVCLLYALYELIRILAKGYAAKQPEEEVTETAEAPEEGIEGEITEEDPETGEDVTDLEVEVVEESAEDADA